MSSKHVTGGSHRTADSFDVLRKPDRQPGDPYYRCLHCSRYRCQRPLQLCPECQEAVERLLAGLPDHIS